MRLPFLCRWEAWTIVGCLGLVLAFMASGRLIWAAMQRRKVGSFYLFVCV